MAFNTAWGIDVGNRALKAVKLVRTAEGIIVDEFEVIEHETVLSSAGDNREQLIQTALANFVQRHPMKGEACSVGVSGQSSFARFIKLPPVEPNKIPEIVRFEAIQQIPFPLEDVEWAYQLFQQPDQPDVEVGIFAMRKELVNQHLSYFTDADLNVQVIQMNPLAVYNAIQFDGRLDGTTMIVDLGAENTDLIIADGESIWMRSIPVGGNNFTEALVKSFKLNFQKAEELKRNAASSKYARQIFQAMRPIFADLVAEVQRSIGFYASVHRDSRIKKIVASGGTFKLPGLQKYLQQNLQLDVERLDRFSAGAPADAKLAGTFNENILSMVSAYGLALQAMGEAKVNSSLLPLRIRKERMWQEKTKWFAAAAALFMLGTGVAYGSWFVHNLSYENAADTRAQIAKVQSKADDLDKKWSAVQTAGGPDRQRIQNVMGLLNYRDFWPKLLVDIEATAPKLQGSIEEIKQIPRGQRKQMFIDSITSKYYANLDEPLKDLKAQAGLADERADGEGGGIDVTEMRQRGMAGMNLREYLPGGAKTRPGAAAAPPPTAAPTAEAGGKRGFVLVVKGVTPYNAEEASGFVEKTLVKSLNEYAADKVSPSRRYYVAKAELVGVMPVGESPRVQQLERNHQLATSAPGTAAAPVAAAEAQIGAPFGGGAMSEFIPEAYRQGGAGRAANRRTPGRRAAAQDGEANEQTTEAPVDPIAAFRDRATGEDVRSDWEFTVVAVVVIDAPLPAPKPANAAEKAG